MIETLEVTVPAPSGEQKRKAYIYLPRSYDGTKKFPVLYMFDGQTLFFDETSPFGDSWRMGEILDGLQAEVIVAAVEADREDRLTEYSPFPFTSEFGASEGKGAAYTDWLVTAFKRTVDGAYRTLSDRENTFLAGSSMGGLMTLFALCRYPDVFKGGAALSPSLWVAPERVGEMLEGIAQNTSLYIDYGEEELKRHGEPQKEGLRRCLDTLIGKGVPFDFRLIAHGGHNEKSWRRQIPCFLRTLKLL